MSRTHHRRAHPCYVGVGVARSSLCWHSSSAPLPAASAGQTADGTSRSVALPLADDQQYLWQLRPAVCSPDGGALIVGVKSSSEGVTVDGAEPTLHLPVGLESLRDQTIVIASIAPTTEQLTITPEGLPVEIEGVRGDQVTLIWQVVDCTRAMELDFNDLGVLVRGG